MSESSLTVLIGWSINKPHFVNMILTEFLMFDFIQTEQTVQQSEHMGVSDFIQYSLSNKHTSKKARNNLFQVLYTSLIFN
jgi:hypothetical protein